jgi:hypothetical protein
MWIAELRLWAGVTLVGLATLGLPSRASAQDKPAENVAAARALGIEGVRLADAGKCTEAIEKLTRAESLYHAPTILGRLGECQVNVGQIVVGTENLNRVVREQLAPNAPKAFKDAQARAQKALDAALPRIGHLTVMVEPKEANASVTVSEVAVPSALIGVERPTDPGSHEVVASAPGYITQRTTVVLAEAGRETVTLRLTLDPNAQKEAPPVAPVAATAAPPPPAAPPPEAKQGMKTLAFVLIGTGVVGVATGSITGAMALSKKSDLDCPDNHCTGKEADKLDSAHTMATISTIGFAVGIPAAAVGTVLLLTSGNNSSKAAKREPAKRFAASPYLGPTSAGVVGSFW